MSNHVILELPKALAEKIAAGEVVSRPASVVKELMENSLDAGASSIVVEIKNGGKAMIRVTDDGSGITGEQVLTAFKRHATSKISTAEDLDSIATLGFRGEALNSIAAVSRVEMVTKAPGEKTGRRVSMEGGEVTEDRPVGAADGTTVVVSDLFYNTPARLKFMKADRTEASLIIDVVSNLALAYPSVKIRLINNGNILYSTPGRGDTLANILTIYGKDVAEGLLPVSASSEGMAVGGYVSPPSKTRSSRRFQLFFINGRAVSSKLLEKAVTEAYRETVFEGRHPAAFLFLELPPVRLDVNIHPAKNEVRFDDEKLLESFVAKAIREVVLTKTAISGIHGENFGSVFVKGGGSSLFGKSSGRAIEKAEEWGNPGRYSVPTVGLEGRRFYSALPTRSNSGNPGEYGEYEEIFGIGSDAHRADCDTYGEGGNTHKMEGNSQEIAADHKWISDRNGDDDDLVDITNILSSKRRKLSPYTQEEIMEMANIGDYGLGEGEYGTGRLSAGLAAAEPRADRGSNLKIAAIQPVATLFSTYIVGVDKDALYLMDQHAAHERVMYESFLGQYRGGEKLIQNLLIPVLINAPLALADEAAEGLVIIRSLGFDIDSFGPRTLSLRGIPAFLTLAEGERFLADILDALPDDITPDNTAAIERVISRACKSAVKGGDELSPEEVRQLLADLDACENPFSCPHGRPVFIRLRERDLIRLFKRG